MSVYLCECGEFGVNLAWYLMGMDCCVPLSEAACQSRRHLTAVSHSTYLHKGADRLAAGMGTAVAVTHMTSLVPIQTTWLLQGQACVTLILPLPIHLPLHYIWNLVEYMYSDPSLMCKCVCVSLSISVEIKSLLCLGGNKSVYVTIYFCLYLSIYLWRE